MRKITVTEGVLKIGRWKPKIGMKVRITKNHCNASGQVGEIGTITEISGDNSFRVETKTSDYANWRCRKCIARVQRKES